MVRLIAGGERPSGAWRPGLAALLAELGMEAEARRELAQLRSDGFDALRASLWVASLTYLADACAAVGDDELAALVYPELAPLRGGNVMIGHGVACYGAADRYLGLLAATLGEHDRAAEHFEQAAGLQPPHGRRRRGSPTRCTATAGPCAPRGRARRRRRGVRAAVGGGDARRACRHADAAGARPRARRERRALRRMPPDGLSWREVDILRLVAAGRSNREIGEQLFISGHTVANHIRSILRKTGAANRTEAAGYAYRHALVDRR